MKLIISLLLAGSLNSWSATLVDMGRTTLTSSNAQVYSDSSSQVGSYSDWAVSFKLDSADTTTANLLFSSYSTLALGGVGTMIGFDADKNLVVRYSDAGGAWPNGTLVPLDAAVGLSAGSTLATVCTQGKLYIYLVENNIASILNEGGFDIGAEGTYNKLNVKGSPGTATEGSSTFWTNAGKTQMSNMKVAISGGVSGVSPEDFLTAMGFSTPQPPAVPEPATATLSLLGLSALMLRRRRGIN